MTKNEGVIPQLNRLESTARAAHAAIVGKAERSHRESKLVDTSHDQGRAFKYAELEAVAAHYEDANTLVGLLAEIREVRVRIESEPVEHLGTDITPERVRKRNEELIELRKTEGAGRILRTRLGNLIFNNPTADTALIAKRVEDLLEVARKAKRLRDQLGEALFGDRYIADDKVIEKIKKLTEDRTSGMLREAAGLDRDASSTELLQRVVDLVNTEKLQISLEAGQTTFRPPHDEIVYADCGDSNGGLLVGRVQYRDGKAARKLKRPAPQEWDKLPTIIKMWPVDAQRRKEYLQLEAAYNRTAGLIDVMQVGQTMSIADVNAKHLERNGLQAEGVAFEIGSVEWDPADKQITAALVRWPADEPEDSYWATGVLRKRQIGQTLQRRLEMADQPDAEWTEMPYVLDVRMPTADEITAHAGARNAHEKIKKIEHDEAEIAKAAE